MSERAKDAIRGICAIIAYLLLNSIPILDIIAYILPFDITKNMNLIFLFNIWYEVVQIVIIILILRQTISRHFNKYIANIKYYLKNYIKYWGVALLLMYVSNLIIIMINNGAIASNEESVRTLFETSHIFTFILAGVLAPIIEELVFRLCFYKIIGTKGYNKYIFIILSGLIFGSMHIIGTNPTLIDWLYIIPYSVPGCVFAYTLVKSDNIFVPISLHAIHNNFALIMQLLASL